MSQKGRKIPVERTTGVHVGAIYGQQADMPLVEIEIVEPTRTAKVQVTLEQVGDVELYMTPAQEPDKDQ